MGRERGEGGGGERRNGGGVAAGRSLRSLGTGAVASVVRRRADWPGAGARGKYVVAKLGGESGGDSAMHGAGGAGDFMLVRVHARGMVMATVIAHYGVMPLLHESREYPIRVAMIVCHSGEWVGT